jgi:cell division protein FtsL
MAEDNIRDIDLEIQESSVVPENPEDPENSIKDTLQKIKDTVSEEDPHPSSQLNLRTILGGDLLTTQTVRSQIWLFILIVGFTIMYVAFRYQCQQDMIKISQLESELKDAKYRALSSSSTLTERCRESQVLEVLRQNKDSVLHASDQPPYIINIPESGLFSGDDE